MKTTEILIITFFIIESILISYFIYIYLKNEKFNKLQREAELQKLQTVILDKIAENHTQLDNKINDITKKILESFEELSKNVKLSQEQANSKVDLGFEQLQKENINIQNDVNYKIADIKTSFKEYSNSVETTLTKFIDDNKKIKIEASKLKEEMQKDLKEILMEIKAPLDLD
jgi:hypothetical protein